jgi:hypothetical protein
MRTTPPPVRPPPTAPLIRRALLVDDALLPVAGQLGLVERQDASWPAMVLTDLPPEPVVAEGLQIRHTADGSGFEEHFRASAAVAGADPALWATWLGPGLAEDPAWTMVTGYADGGPVARSMSYRTGDVVGVYNVGTIASARRRGYGWAVTLAAIMSGVAAGATVATLQSSGMALLMYQAHGFRALFRYRAFCRARACPDSGCSAMTRQPTMRVLWRRTHLTGSRSIG